MSQYRRASGGPSDKVMDLTPEGPVDMFREDIPNEGAADPTLNDGRVMYRAGQGLVISVGGAWVPFSLPKSLWCPASAGKLGAAAGWDMSSDDGLARLPQSQTSSTLIIPVLGLNVGDVITGARVIGQVESVGAAVTVLFDLFKATAAEADFSEASIGSQQTTGALTADTLISAAILEILGEAETIGALDHVFALITGTTAAVTDVAISGIQVEVAGN